MFLNDKTLGLKSAFVLFLCTLSLGICSCSSEAEQSVPPAQILNVKGDPGTFIAHTKRNNTQGIPQKVFSKLSKNWFSHPFIISTEPQEKISNLDETQKKTESSEIVQFKKYFVSNYWQIDNKRWILKDKHSDGDSLHFKLSNGKLFLKEWRSRGRYWKVNEDFTIEHYSTHRDFTAFTILISLAKPYKSLITFRFSLSYPPTPFPATLNKIYSYLWGYGVSMSWENKKPLLITLCPQGAARHYQEWVELAAQEWKSVLKDRLELFWEKSSGPCPPFSDLNTQTLLHVSDWLTVDNPKILNPAFVLSHGNFATGHIIDADLFVLESEWNKSLENKKIRLDQKKAYENPNLQIQYYRTQLHEWGHILGLGHEFDGVLSIMSYQDHERISAHDRAALQTLYPLINEQ